MTGEVISIGDELLIGQVINTNQAFISQLLAGIGVSVERMTTVGDNERAILDAFHGALSRHHVVIVTGGLGPTHDDVTRSAVCRFFQTDLVMDDEALGNIKALFQRRGTPLITLNEDQALVPRGCITIPNREGTAPGYLFERDSRFFIVMPGVPFEMKRMMKEFVVPYLSKRVTGTAIQYRTLKTTGIAESMLAHRLGDIKDILDRDPDVSLAFLPSPLGVRLRITARARRREEAQQRIEAAEKRIREKVEKYIYGVDDQELEEVVGGLLAEKKMTIAVAESCTGGVITDRITNVPGSSNYFERGMIVYSNDSKMDELGVPLSLIVDHGAVSREVAEAMAFGIRTKANTDIGISTTGIAGPSGGTAEKPVGLVWIGYSDRSDTFALRFDFAGNRRRIKERAAQASLELVRRRLLKIES